MLLTFYNYYFYLTSANNSINLDSSYILILHDEYIPLDVSSLSTSTSLGHPSHLDDDDKTN